MVKHNPENERIKHRYLSYLRDAKRQSEASIDKAMAAIARFEADTKFKPFKKFHIEQAIAFKRRLAESKSDVSGKPLSVSSQHSILSSLKVFVLWLADQSGYRSRVSYSDAEYFNISEKDRSVATAKRMQPVPTPEQIEHVLNSMPATTEMEKRNRALIAFIYLTGARDGAVASLNLGHVDLEQSCVYQDARVVKTKFSKTFTTWFFPVGELALNIVSDWVDFLRKEKLLGDSDPLFPATKVKVGPDRKFGAQGLDRKHWSNATPIRKVFKDAFETAGLPYFNPHSFRNTLARLGEQACRSPEFFKAWSQNLGHENVMTTLVSYGSVSDDRQAQIMQQLGTPLESEATKLEQIRKVLSV